MLAAAASQRLAKYAWNYHGTPDPKQTTTCGLLFIFPYQFIYLRGRTRGQHWPTDPKTQNDQMTMATFDSNRCAVSWNRSRSASDAQSIPKHPTSSQEFAIATQSTTYRNVLPQGFGLFLLLTVKIRKRCSLGARDTP